MNCPHCNTHIDEHPASRCLDAWVTEAVFEGAWDAYPYPCYSTSIAAAKEVSDKAGYIVIFAPHSSVRDGSYANRKKVWLVEIIPYGRTTKNAVWAYGETEEIARCRAAIKAMDNSK